MIRIKKKMLSPKKGSLLAIILFAFMMGIIGMGTMTIAFTMYASGQESSKRYADFQTYRAATEMATYNYIKDLETIVVEHTLDGDWLSQANTVVFDDALQQIVNEVGLTAEPLTYRVTTAESAIGGTAASDMSIVTKTVGAVTAHYNAFKLFLLDYPALDYEDPTAYLVFGETNVPLKPVEVHVNLQVKGESLKEKIYVDGLFLNVIAETNDSPTGGYISKLTMKIVEGANGLTIFRV